MPVLEIKDDCIVSKTGDYSIGFELIKPEIFTLSAAQYDAYHQAWVKAIGLLPVNSVLHMQGWYVQAKYSADFETVKDNVLDRASERYFHERPYLDHKAYLFLTKKTTKRTPSRFGATTRSVREGKMELILQGIYLRDGLLWMSFELRNESKITYRPDYIRCMIRQKKRMKRMAIQEMMLQPVYGRLPSLVAGDSAVPIVLGSGLLRCPGIIS